MVKILPSVCVGLMSLMLQYCDNMPLLFVFAESDLLGSCLGSMWMVVDCSGSVALICL